MNILSQLAFICTGKAPKGGELFKIQLGSAIAVLVGSAVYILLLWIINKKINNKRLRIFLYLVLTLIALTALGALLFAYTLSTCGY